MKGKKKNVERVIRTLREIEVLRGQGASTDEACRQADITKQTFYRWRKEYGGLEINQAKKLKMLEKENARLKKLVADMALDNTMLKTGVRSQTLQRKTCSVSSWTIIYAHDHELLYHLKDNILSKCQSGTDHRACRLCKQSRSTQRRNLIVRDNEGPLTKRIIELAMKYGRYGYRRITAMLQREGWRVNHKRVERIWRQEGLKIPQKRCKKGRLWMNDGSALRLRPESKVHVWSYEPVSG